jgi:hypothetical protein
MNFFEMVKREITAVRIVYFCAAAGVLLCLGIDGWLRFTHKHEIPWLFVSILLCWSYIGFSKYKTYCRSHSADDSN